MIITLRQRWLIRLFWRSTYDGKPRTIWPTSVTASHVMWWDWFKQKWIE